MAQSPPPRPPPPTPRFRVYKEHANGLRDFRAEAIGHEADPQAFLDKMSQNVEKNIGEELIKKRGVKTSLILTVVFEKAIPGSAPNTAYFRSIATPILQSADIREVVQKAKAEIMGKIDKFVNLGSGWRVKRVESLDIGVAKFKPFRGRSYFPTPNYIPPRSVINVQNADDRCFEWAILSAMYPAVKDAQRPTKYRSHLGELDFRGIEFPVKSTDAGKFEKQNPTIAVSVFGWDKGPYPIRISDENRAYNVDLLLLYNGDRYHYVWIKDLGSMLYKNSKHKARKYPCRRCLHIFSRQDLLDSHVIDCRGILDKPQRIEMPKEGENILKFQNHHKQLQTPYVIYADFEALNVPVQGAAMNPNESNSRKIADQKPCSFCYVVVRSDGQANEPVLYRGEDAVKIFLQHMIYEASVIEQNLLNPAKMVMTEVDEQDFYRAAICHICEKPLNNDKVRDHCHITGNYRGAAHNECNLKLRINPQTCKIAVAFHNLKNYDGHLIMQGIDLFKFEKIGCIPNTKEKYMTFNLDRLQFLDSLQFLNSSLAKLAVNLRSEDLKITASVNRENFDLLRRKGSFPYEYIDDFYRFDEVALPSKEAFYSKLSREHTSISDADYEHAQNVWNTFDCKTLGDYHDLYLRPPLLVVNVTKKLGNPRVNQRFHLRSNIYSNNRILALQANR